MSLSALQSTRLKAYRLLGAPTILVVVTSFVLLIFTGINAGYSALLGGLGWALPNFYFASKIFAKSQAKTSKTILGRFYRAELVKLLLTAIYFVLVVKFIPVSILTFLLTFLGAQLAFWLATIIVMTK